MLDVHQATRYVVPLREGGSLPAVLDTDGAGLFVTKFRGAGQGARALIAEIVVARLAGALDVPVPETVLVELDESFGLTERDPEIQDILRGSRGLNVGMRYLEGAFNFDPGADTVDPDLASRIVWLDALTTNLDRTSRNPNLLWWHGRIWLIDQGAAMYFHHNWKTVDTEKARDPFQAIHDHVLLRMAADLARVDGEAAETLTPELLVSVLEAVPDELLMDSPAGSAAPFGSADENRAAYLRYFTDRLSAPRPFVEQATESRQRLLQTPAERKGYRR